MSESPHTRETTTSLQQEQQQQLPASLQPSSHSAAALVPHHHDAGATSTSDGDATAARDNADAGSGGGGDRITAHVRPVGPFALTPQELAELTVPHKSVEHLAALGGVGNVLRGLLVDAEVGLSSSPSSAPPADTSSSSHGGKIPPPSSAAAKKLELAVDVYDPDPSAAISIELRRSVFGANMLPAVKPKGLLSYMLAALSDKIMIILSIAAFVSLGIGLYQDFRTLPADAPATDKQKVHWIEGFAIIVAVLVVVLASSINDLQKEAQFRKLNAKKEDRQLKAVRDGSTQLISVYDIVVGDILLLEPGDVIAADGVFISGMGLRCDESSATGETDAVKKTEDGDPFFLSGSKVLEGIGKYVVTAVGERSFFGKTMMALRTESEDTPLQVKLDALAERIAKAGVSVAIIMFATLLLKYVITVQKTNGFGEGRPDQESGTEVAQRLVNILISSITIVVVAVPEGLPLAVTLALAYATTQMLKENNLVRVLSACETMGNATTICSDKTGTLTQNKMTVVKGVIGKNVFFDGVEDSSDLSDRISRLPSSPAARPNEALPSQLKKSPGPSGVVLFDTIMEGCSLNSSVFESKDEKTGETTLVGSKTETALLEWVTRSGFSYKTIRSSSQIDVVQVYPFSSERKSMSTLVRIEKPDEKPIYRLHVKGASEIVLRKCDRFALLPFSDSIRASERQPVPTPGSRSNPPNPALIEKYASQSLRTICIAFREFTEEEFFSILHGTEDLGPLTDEDLLSDPLAWNELVQHLICAAVVGIEDPLRPGVPEAVRQCQQAGVFVRMVTGDNVVTAKSIATQCGIYTRGGIVMEGSYFRRMSPEEMAEKLPRLQVLARSSPTDKQLLVSKLKEMGETVAVTGDGTNDGPALKSADIGFSMGIAGTEVAKEASSIVLMDDSFSSVVKAIVWGRQVNDSVKKFLQFQLSVNVSAVAITFVSAVADSSEGSVLTAVQLLWVNLIMDTLAALALATEKPVPDLLLSRPPESKRAPLIGFAMWQMIFSQAALQIVINLTLVVSRHVNSPANKATLRTIVFNSFVLLQVFNMISSRRLGNHINVIDKIWENPAFIAIFTMIFGLQAIIVQFGGQAFSTVPLDAKYWGICILIGLLSIPWGIVVKLVSTRYVLSTSSRPARNLSMVDVLLNFSSSRST
ncbi:PMCA-type calcium-translocating P-type ATPase [Zopfochytrium polystomum]|nr:PMCA-type calcium-translocating P-type ATPase [Zopfochytrium polystomum]